MNKENKNEFEFWTVIFGLIVVLMSVALALGVSA